MPDIRTLDFNIGIGAPENSIVVIRLYNSVGQVVYNNARMRVQNGHSAIDLEGVSPGVYLLEVISGDMRASTRLMIIGER